MVKSIVFASLIVFATNVYAGLNQIKVIGLVPGVSTEDDVNAASTKIGNSTMYVIGGYAMFCTPTYVDGRLFLLECMTGEKYMSMDTTNSNKIASNTEIHNALVEGFSKKFGRPSTVDNSTVSNKLGTKFNRNATTWTDKKGNKLILNSMDSNIDDGSVILLSAERIRQLIDDNKKTEKLRKF